MAKNKNDYFTMMEQQIDCCVQASALLVEMFSKENVEDIAIYKSKIHSIEHKGDKLQHEILAKLSREFITPIDQEDILRLVQLIDDVTDALDEVVLELYMFHIDRRPAKGPEMSRLIERCVKALQAAVVEMRNFKKPEKLRTLLTEVNDVEAEADGVYVEAIHGLFATETESKVLIGHKAIYESLENCCDLCEHASDVIEQIIIKNT